MAPKKAKAKTNLRPRIESLPSSYMSLFYGVATVVVVSLIVFFGIRVFTHVKSGEVTKESVKTEQASQLKVLENSYTVKEGDNLWKIAEQFYKSGYNWVDIAKANKLSQPGIINAGTKLVIPNVASKQLTVIASADTGRPVNDVNKQANAGSVSNTTENKITGGKYTVQAGDSLWTIALRAYGDGYKWTEVAKANKLVNPNTIHSGNVLQLPR